MTYFSAQAVSKTRIEGVNFLGLREFGWARGFGRYSGGVRKKTEPLGGYVKKQGGTKILVGMEKNYFLSMLPLVGRSPFSRGLLLLVGSRGYLRGNRAICRGT